MLLLHNPRRQQIQVGRLGLCDFVRGWYLYVGSAFGPGGVAARCAHHRRISLRPRWHIDYLRAATNLRQIWYSNDPRRREHQWAALLGEPLGLGQPIGGFGSSDCDCGSHLFISAVKPDWKAFAVLAGERLSAQQAINCEIV
ncbi:MAG: GIY-YIG nuclease family protein [Candidatus Thiodiazotropha lotti]|uniref:GIY-YIG nuclease family protein n=1 Tax=Candidatus Thiodiazotropha lotti TaxID=2792787 RepID=A0A9E4N2B4_9GAMM|nr:GIY-YIG nuclease family protein [Candidatus Thiodiazotropha lotti]MCG7929809.1 GIY-YIG nuclease family protein [Candidatus Thiodiazotropha lotti]MCG7940655.1 GIY-YIG nuclease family protein [Candidatus Thiodiazotropha lotti]MCG7989572.1 GIY-YIG nuclease family protein [Candidatus Thiodiazotropha lotti]MCG8002635.1 GIY-YIG nuclease family protein [Candidatus Thiodiazotropha lotti]